MYFIFLHTQSRKFMDKLDLGSLWTNNISHSKYNRGNQGNTDRLSDSRLPTYMLHQTKHWFLYLEKHRPMKRICNILRPPLWSSGQSSWLQIQRSRHLPEFLRSSSSRTGPLSLVRTIEELLERKRSGSGLENRKDGLRNPLHLPRDTLYPQMFALNPPTISGRSAGNARSRTKAKEFVLLVYAILSTRWSSMHYVTIFSANIVSLSFSWALRQMAVLSATKHCK
jgi:hypothetical protein